MAAISSGSAVSAPSNGAAPDFKDIFTADPALQGNADQAFSALTRDQNASADFSQQFAQESQGRDAEIANLQTPQDMMPEIMQQTPFLIGLTAIAGALTKQSGLAMLSGINGMVQGLNQGDEKGYEQAWQRYKAEADKLRERRAEQQRIYTMYKEAYKDRVDADLIAYKKAMEITKDNVQNKMWSYEQTRHAAEWADKTVQANQRLSMQADKIAVQQERLNVSMGQKAVTEYYKAEQGLTRMDQARDSLKDNLNLMPTLIEKYKNQYGKDVTVPGNFAKFLESVSRDPEVGQFAANITNMKAALVGIDMPQGSRGNLFMNKLFAGTAPELFTDSPAAIEAKLKNDFNVVSEGRARTLAKMDTWKKQAEKADIPITQPDLGDAQPRSGYPAAHIATEADIQATMRGVGLSREVVIKSLKAKGFTIEGEN